MQSGSSLLVALSTLALASPAFGGDFALKLRSQHESPAGSGQFARQTRDETWPAERTAVIVCDVWDYHHCLNAVRRLEEFAPRLNDLLKEARRRGATIIHSPSDCMPAYADHPARQRAMATVQAERLPRDIESWCSRVPAEERAVYPIDQSDGGEDDDPAEHAEWAAKLKALGRNPGMPWKTQSKLIEIDIERDFISDRGDEVWNILEARGIRHVILTGVHTNMCVLGRPFGLRQMARNGRQVVLVRDMTDCMYNPKRWPYVDHFTGNDLIVAHIEQFVCPTITSDQILGGQSFRSKTDTRPKHDLTGLDVVAVGTASRATSENHWSLVSVPLSSGESAASGIKSDARVVWYRCAVRIPAAWKDPGRPHGGPLLSAGADQGTVTAWFNGQAMPLRTGSLSKDLPFEIPVDKVEPNDPNLIALRVARNSGPAVLSTAPVVSFGKDEFSLKGRWQFRVGDDPAWCNMPLPAKFGASPDILFEPAGAKAEPASPRDLLKQSKRIVFLGDSITAAGRYVACFDAWLELQELAPKPVIIDAGLPSETVSGLSEDGHAGGKFPRPDLAERLERVLATTKPDLVIACYGINCGIYQPFDKLRFEKYQQGMTSLKSHVEQAGAKFIVMTPPFYDDQRSPRAFSYNEVLDQYGDWLVERRASGWQVVDLHAPMTNEVRQRRESDPKFTFQPDGVHPNDEGHWFVAQQLIRFFGDETVSTVATPQAMLAAKQMPETLFPLVQQRINVLRDAYVSAAGHKRPGVAAGLPIPDAEAKARELTSKIDALRQSKQK